MQLPLDYVDLLLIAAAALLFLLLLFLVRQKQIGRRSPLERALSNSKGAAKTHQDLLMSLLVLEEQYPIFGRIAALVIERCGIRRLIRHPDFIEPARYLAQAAFSEQQSSVRGALCHMVRGFLEDPDIEYKCRPELAGLIDQFIEEIDLEQRPGSPPADSSLRKD